MDESTTTSWDSVARTINDGIDMSFPTKTLRLAKTLAHDILECEMLCIDSKGKFMWLKPEILMLHQQQHPKEHLLSGRVNKKKRYKHNKRLKQRQQHQHMGQLEEEEEEAAAAAAAAAAASLSSDVHKVNILSFIRDATRSALGNEKKPEWRYYRPIVRMLLERGATSDFVIKNHHLKK